MTSTDIQIERAGANYRLTQKQWFAQSPEELWPFFSSAHNLERITPPLLNFRVTTPSPIEMRKGAVIDYRLRIRGVPVGWKTLISEWNPPHSFVDEQLRGPYRLWHHEHIFEAVDGGTLATDRVHYRLPLGPLGHLAHRALVRRDVSTIFSYRAEALEQIFDIEEAQVA